MQSCIIIIHQATCAILTIGTIWYRILSFTLLILYIINLGHFHCYKVYTSKNKLHNRILSGLSYIILIRQCHSEIKMVHYSNLSLSIIVQSDGVRCDNFEVELDWASSLCGASWLVFPASTPSSKFLMTLSNVPK